MIANKYLATYLNNHLAGSVGAIELLSSLEAAQTDPNMVRFVAELRHEIKAAQAELEALLTRLQIAKSTPRQATAWFAEKFTQLKLRLDDPAAGALYLLESLEAIAIGLEGQRALWCALTAAAVPGLQISDYEQLKQRAEAQHQRVEAMRLVAAQTALAM